MADIKQRLTKSAVIRSVAEENDDVQVTDKGQGSTGSICVTVGPNGFRDTNPIPPDTIDGNESIVAGGGGCHTDANRSIVFPTDVPSKTEVQSSLNEIWGKQANINFNVDDGPNLVVNYDINRNTKLDDDVGELNKIPGAAKTAGAINIYFVSEMTDPPGTTIGIQMQSFVQPLAGTVLNTIAHEVGHALGISLDEEIDANDTHLMHGFVTGKNPCQLRRQDWEKVNP